MAVTITKTLTGTSEFARQIKHAAAPKVAFQLQRVADDAVARTEAIIAVELPPRSGHRHKKGTRYLGGSISATVDFNGEFPVYVTIKSSANEKKVAALEYGVFEPHPIDARNAPMLLFPHSQTGRRVMVPSVNHPGNKAYHFMRRGLVAAMRSRYGQARGMRAARG